MGSRGLLADLDGMMKRGSNVAGIRWASLTKVLSRMVSENMFMPMCMSLGNYQIRWTNINLQTWQLVIYCSRSANSIILLHLCNILPYMVSES
jgi:hypothetical protein